MKGISCLTNAQIDKLEKNYNLKGKLNPLMDLKDISELEQQLEKINGLNALKKDEDAFKNFKGDIEKYSRTNNFFIRLKTGRAEKDVERGFTWYDLDGFAEMFNSSFISLYRYTQLSDLLATNGEQGNLKELFRDFLYGARDEKGQAIKDADGNKQYIKGGNDNYKFLNGIKAILSSKDYAYKDIANDEQARVFYGDSVLKLMNRFIAFYYDTYFKPNIFKPYNDSIKEQYPNRKTDELLELDTKFKSLSKNKDIINGFIIEAGKLEQELNKLKTLTEKAEFIEKSPFYGMVQKVMESFKLNDSSTSTLFSLDSQNAEEEESESFRASDDNASRSFEFQGNERSGFESSSNETKAVLASLFDAKDNKVATDEFGMPVLINSFTAYKKLSKVTRGIIDYKEFYNALNDRKVITDNPFIPQLLKNYLIDPDPKALDKFFEQNESVQFTKQKIKQSMLQDLSKDESIAKEIILESKKEKAKVYKNEEELFLDALVAASSGSTFPTKKKKARKSKEIININVRNAKLRGDRAVFNDSKARFNQKYILNKNEFSTLLTNKDGSKTGTSQVLIDKSGNIRVTAWYQAAEAVNDLEKKFRIGDTKNINYQNIYSILNILGIMPDTIDSADVIKLYRDHEAAIVKFFNRLPVMKRFTTLVNEVKNKNVKSNVQIVKLEINKEIAKYENRVANTKNIKDLKDNINKLKQSIKNKFVITPNTDNEAVKEYLKGIDIEGNTNAIIEEYLDSITNILEASDVKGEKVSSYKTEINQITNRFENAITSNFDEILNVEFEKAAKSEFDPKIFLQVNDPIQTLNQNFTGLEGLYSSYANYEQEKNTQYDNDMVIDHNGKDRSQVQLLDNVLIKTKDLNQGREKMLTRFPELDPTRNHNVATSIIYNQLFSIEPDGSIIKTSSKSKLEANNIMGVKIASKTLKTGSMGITSLNREDNALSSIILLLFNGNEESANGDKASSRNLRFSNFDRSKYAMGSKELQRSGAANEFLPITAEEIAKLYNTTFEKYITRNNKDITKEKTESNMQRLNISPNAIDSMDPIAGVFSKYLAGYLLTYYEVERGDMQYVKEDYKNLGKNYEELGLFSKDSSKTSGKPGYIIDKNLKALLKEKVLELNLKKKSVVEKIDIINNLIKSTDFDQFKSDLLNFFNSQVNNLVEGLGTYASDKAELANLIGIFEDKSDEANNLQYYSAFKDPKADAVNYQDMLKAILMTYVVNFNILTQEKMLLCFGDPAFLKESTYIKRVPGNNGTGNYSLIDEFDIAMHNDPRNKVSFGYAKAFNEKLIKEGKSPINMENHKLGYTFRFGQVKDHYVSSDTVFKNMEEGFGKSIRKKYPNLTDEEVKVASKRALDPYKSMNEADGFGVITFDWYRIFSIQTNSWTAAQESLYKKIIAGERVEDGIILTTFPIKKFSYVGAAFLNNKQLPADTTHKYSLAPLIPGYGDTNLQIKHENLIKEGKAYEIFDSASKRETLTSKNPKNTFYDDAKTRTIKPLEANKKGEYVSGKDSVYAITGLLKDQVYIDPAIKTKSILARQLKRVIKTDLYNQGVPVDFKKTKEEWDKLTEKQKREQSTIHRIYRGVMDDIGSINDKEETILLEKFGMAKVKEKNKVEYVLVDKQKLFNTVKKEMSAKASKQASGSGTVYSKLLNIESRRPDANLEAFSNLNNIKSTIKGLIEKDTKLRKYNGSNLIQAPITGSEPVSFNKKDIAVDRNGYLKSYEYGDDKTRKAEVMITFSEKWTHLLKLKHDGFTIRTIENLNKALLDENWVKENEDKISMLAVRVPIQDPNSIEAFVIKQFLPMTAGSKIVVPSEIVAKAGSDYDIDKLMLYFYNIDEDGALDFDDSMKGLENRVIKGYLDLLLLPEMFYKLITANSISSLKKNKGESASEDKIADKLREKTKSIVEEYDETDLRTPMLNIDIKTLLQDNKGLLGHGATVRSNFEELKHSGFTTASEMEVKINPSLTYYDREMIKENNLRESEPVRTVKTAAVRLPFVMDHKNNELAYNQISNENGIVISLSSIFNKKGTPISELISATMNGFVDIANDTWITILAMNAELTSLNYFMIMGGVPEEMVYSFNNQKVIQDFIKNKLSLKESLFKRLLNPNRDTSDTRVLYDTFTKVLNGLRTKETVELKDKDGIPIKDEQGNIKKIQRFILSEDTKQKLKKVLINAGINDSSGAIKDLIDNYDNSNRTERNQSQLNFKINIESELFDAFADMKKESFLTEEELLSSVGLNYAEMNEEQLTNQFKLLAFLPFIKNYSESLTRLLQAEDYDKSKSQYIHDDYSNKQTITQIKRDSNFPKNVVKQFEKLNVSAQYDMSDLTTALFEAMAPLTESKEINTYAISLYKYLGENNKKFIPRTKKDAFINSFKSDFINFIVQNYGTISDKGKRKNIVEYLIDNSVFADKTTKDSFLSSADIDDQSVATKLFTLLDSFKTFKQLEVFKYLNSIRTSKISEEEIEEGQGKKVDYLYKIGRIFKNLTGVELDNFNKELRIFSEANLDMTDVLQSIQDTNGEVLYRFLDDLIIERVKNKGKQNEEVELINKDIDSVLAELNKLLTSDGRKLTNFATIPIDAISEDTYALLRKFLNKAGKTKAFVSKVLPYMSILQSTSMYSSTYISNLFVNKNYNIVKDILNRFVKESGIENDSFNWEETLNNFLPLFLLNNRTLISNDKNMDLLTAIAGDEELSKNNIVNAANFFNNYYQNEFSMYALKNDYRGNVLDNILAVADENNLFKGFIGKIQDINEKIKEGEDIDLSDVDYSDNSIVTTEEQLTPAEEPVVLDKVYTIDLGEKGIFTVESKNKRIKNSEGIILSKAGLRNTSLQNEVLVNYFRAINQLKMSTFNGVDYFVLDQKILTPDYKVVLNNKEEILLGAVKILECKIG